MYKSEEDMKNLFFFFKWVELIRAYSTTQTEINPLPLSHLSERSEHGSVGSAVHCNFSLSDVNEYFSW